jgi:ectoine hydroxylase-related dioxygenase (phytanoyl-CoA dioxygenase family)
MNPTAPRSESLNNALAKLGVNEHTLSAAEKAQLDQQGYIVFGKVITTEEAREMAASIDRISAAEAENAGKDFHTEAGTTRLGTLINKDSCFDVCFLHPKALAAIAHVITGDFGLSSITSRTALPGEGGQGLHCDCGLDFFSANALWMVDDFTAENGPTRLVPGSHRSGKRPEDVIDPHANHPDQVRLLGPAGSLVVINAHTWHGGTRNGSPRPRRLISAFFSARDCYQSIAHRRLNDASRQRLSPAARTVLDFVED